ncbi:hypothetical protein GCM10023335_04830 [Streptomyces siamensis]|uniref:Transposase n=1 Tax=Streptomyces siamensis TaxID=1274986 RepID=A0ABP9IEX7_9ACTN
MSSPEPAGVPGRDAIAPGRVLTDVKGFTGREATRGVQHAYVLDHLAAHNRAVCQGLLTTWRELGAAVPRCPRRSYHPSREGSLRRAVEYLALSPAARTAAAAIGRAATA